MARAVVMQGNGGPEVLKLVQDFPVPKLQEGEVLIRQKSTSVNPVDYKTRTSFFEGGATYKVLGGDACGVIEASQASQFRPGDHTIALTLGYVPGVDAYGTYADKVVSKAEWTVKVSDKFPLEIGGGLPLVALTAFQLAKVHFGAGHVVATGSAHNSAFMKEVGADETVDYRSEDFAQKYRDAPFDLIVDPQGGDVETRSYKVLAPGGTYAHISSSNKPQKGEAAASLDNGKKYTFTRVVPSAEQLKSIAQYVEEGKIRIVVGKEFTLNQIREAHEAAEAGGYRGKVVVKIS